MQKKGEEYQPEKSKLYIENEVNFSTETIYSDKKWAWKWVWVLLFMTIGMGLMSYMICPVE
jgi:hypothetical protein